VLLELLNLWGLFCDIAKSDLTYRLATGCLQSYDHFEKIIDNCQSRRIESNLDTTDQCHSRTEPKDYLDTKVHVTTRAFQETEEVDTWLLTRTRVQHSRTSLPSRQ